VTKNLFAIDFLDFFFQKHEKEEKSFHHKTQKKMRKKFVHLDFQDEDIPSLLMIFNCCSIWRKFDFLLFQTFFH